MKAIRNATLVMRDHLIPDGVILIEDGKIISFGERKHMTIPEECEEVVDAKGNFVGPGFIDIHTHSDGEVFFQDDPVRASQHHLKHGTTTVLPALYYSMTAEEYVRVIRILRKAMENPDCANIAGLYMEGPYLNPKFGCDRESNPWKEPVAQKNYMPIIEEAWDLAKVWALAPEREHILDFVQDVRKKNPAAVFSVAHSEATPQQVEALMPYGLKIGTHHTNATGTLDKYPECRGVCVDEAVNYNPEIYAELICDSRGIHVDPYMLLLVRKIKGDDRKAKDFIDNLQLFSLLANVADVKSLVIHPASTTHSQMTEEELLGSGIKPNTIRLSIGTENVDDIIEDLDEAFKAVK